MKIWFLYDGDMSSDTPGVYEIKRLQDVGRSRGHIVEVYNTA